MKVLVIIDPQYDFVYGSLAVPLAEQAMQYLAEWIRAHLDAFDAVVVTMDQHPVNHCSFKDRGGLWPRHCVRYSVGAAIVDEVFDALVEASRLGRELIFMEKATEEQTEEYSAFAQSIPSILLEAEHIYLAGLAGDYCVAASESDLLRSIPREKIERLEDAIAWITPPLA